MSREGLTLKSVDHACNLALSQLAATYSYTRQERGAVVMYVIERNGIELGRWIIGHTRQHTGGPSETPGIWWCCPSADLARQASGTICPEEWPDDKRVLYDEFVDLFERVLSDIESHCSGVRPYNEMVSLSELGILTLTSGRTEADEAVPIKAEIRLKREPEAVKARVEELLSLDWLSCPPYSSQDGSYYVPAEHVAKRDDGRCCDYLRMPILHCFCVSVPLERSHHTESFCYEVGAISFQIKDLGGNETLLTGRCEPAAVEELFRQKLAEMAELWPEAKKQLAEQLGMDYAGRRRPGHPGLDQDELVYRLASAQEAEEIRAATGMHWKEIAKKISWRCGTNSAGVKLLEDARKRLERLKKNDPDHLLEEVTQWRKTKET